MSRATGAVRALNRQREDASKRRSAKAMRAKFATAYDGTLLTTEQIAGHQRQLRAAFYARRGMRAPS